LSAGDVLERYLARLSDEKSTKITSSILPTACIICQMPLPICVGV